MIVISRPALMLCALLTTSLCAKKIPPCQDDIWVIDYEENAEEGHAQLAITVPDISEKIQSVSSILTCNDLEVNGTGKSILQVSEGQNTTVFHISILEPKNVKEYEEQGGWQTHHCVLQLSYLSPSKSDNTDMEEVECEVKLLTVFGRILPRCDLTKAQPLLKHVEISKDMGQVLLHFHNSGNEVFTHDSKCEVGSIDDHNHAAAMEDNMIPLAPPGADNPIIDIDFYPDCDNETVYEKYKDREMSNCHLEIYQVCQEGHQLVQYLELDFDEGALKCETPKTTLQVMLESLELLFFIDSRPVVGLIFVLICNMTLYLLLIPIAVCKLMRCSRATESPVAEEKKSLLDNPQTPPVSPVAPLVEPQLSPAAVDPQTWPPEAVDPQTWPPAAVEPQTLSPATLPVAEPQTFPQAVSHV